MNADKIEVRVAAITQVAPLIREFRLEAVSDRLPAFAPGSHVVVEMPAQPRPHRNAYSLLSDPRDPSAYRIAVRKQEQSRGGSLFMHEQVSEGDVLKISPPANMFTPSWYAKRHLLIAGGVGITPFLSFLPELQRRGAAFELHYLYRGTQTGAYSTALAEQLGAALQQYDSDRGCNCDLNALLAQQKPGTHVYICGPESLIDGVCAAARALGWPDDAVHYEAFAAPAPGNPFRVELAQSGRVLEVGSDTSLLEALESAEVAVPNLCRGGVCGQCVTGVLAGSIEHRDAFLSAADKARNDCIMPCVSRAAGDHLKLDL